MPTGEYSLGSSVGIPVNVMSSDQVFAGKISEKFSIVVARFHYCSAFPVTSIL